jgi:hypothetical protein
MTKIGGSESFGGGNAFQLSSLYEAWRAGDFGRLIIMGRVRDGLADHADLVAFITQDGQQPAANPRLGRSLPADIGARFLLQLIPPGFLSMLSLGLSS